MIPAGIDNGQSVRIRDKGEPGINGGPRGDLLVEVMISGHPIFQRQDTNLYSTAPISFAQAALEALSRGAEEAVFVENNKKAADCIEENIRFTKFTEESTLMRTDVLTALCQLEGRKYFDIVFMDPPYGKELEKEVLTYLATSKLIDEDSLIIVEMSDRTTFDYVHELGFTVEKLKKYKTNMHLFLKRAGQKED